MRVLVTGGAGFIGSNLVDALVARGDEVTVMDDLSTGRDENLSGALREGANLAEEDIRDAGAVGSLFERARPEHVFHLAAQIDVRRSVSDPGFDAGINVVGSLNLLEAARTGGVERFVFSSTGGALYGDADVVPSPESTAIAPLAPYGQAKFAVEGYLELYRRLYDLPTVSLRYGNVYGPRQDPLGEAGVVAIFCGKLTGGGRPIIFGDGTQTRDYVNVEDVVAANLAVADSDVSGAYNVARGEETSVLGLVEALNGLGRGALDPQHEPSRLGEVQRSALDCSAAAEAFGWRAEVDLEDGLERTLAALD